MQSLRKLRRSDPEFVALFKPQVARKDPTNYNSAAIQLKRDLCLFDDPVERKAPTAAQIFWDDIMRMF
jgi:hypothetical protein